MSTLKVPYIRRTRDYVAVTMANMALRCASPEYRQLIEGSIEYGLRAAARDHEEGREAPADWRRQGERDED